MTAARQVRLVHEGGSEKLVDEVQVLASKKHVAIQWPTAGLMWFNFATGRALGSPRGPWRLSEEDRAFYCQQTGTAPKAAKLKAKLLRDRKKQDVHDPRQLWLKGSGQ